MNIPFKITIESIEKTFEIIERIEPVAGHKTFHNHYHIIYDIITSFEHGNLSCLEIGPYAGASAALMCSNTKVNKVISIDIASQNEEPCKRNVDKFKNKDCDYHFIVGDSKSIQTVNMLDNICSEFDIIFIDGDHHYDYVISDFKLYSPKLKKGGYLIFDDYNDTVYCPDVRPAVDFIVENLNDREYEIIGSISYPEIKKTNSPHLNSSNEFILRKI